jgi:hypothetical protein
MDLFGRPTVTQPALFQDAPPAPEYQDPAPLPAIAQRPAQATQQPSAADAWRRWSNRPWAKADATDKRIARKFADGVDATGEMF